MTAGRPALSRPSLLVAVVAVSVTLRVASALYLGNAVEILPGTADQRSYHTLATRFLTGHGFSFPTRWWPMTEADEPTAHWSYLYTLFLAGNYWLAGVVPVVPRLLQAVIVGVAHPLLTFALARRAFGPSVGLVAAALAAVYAYFVYYSATLMTEPFYITAILLSLYLAMNLAESVAPSVDTTREEVTPDRRLRLALALGAAMGVTVLLRQVFLLTVPLILAWILVAVGAASRSHRRATLNRVAAPLLVAIAVMAAVILPWTAYNYARFNRFVLLNTNAGYAFFWANNPVYGTRFEDILPPEMGSYQELVPEEVRHLDEVALDRELMRRGLGFVAADPMRYAQLSMSRVAPYFKFWPSADSSPASNVARVSSFGLTLPFMLYGLWLAFRTNGSSSAGPTARRRRTDAALLALFAAAYSAIHLASWALIRYRLPVDAVLLPFAAMGVWEVFGRLRRPGRRLE